MKYLISISDLKGSSLINDNVDESFINEAIENVQTLHLAPILGEELYQKLLSGVTSLGFTLSDDYYNLITEYIHPFMKARIEAEILIPVSYKIRNMGLVQNTDEHSSVPGLKDLRAVEQKYIDIASAYSVRLTKYLYNNRTLFPEYKCHLADPTFDTIITLD